MQVEPHFDLDLGGLIVDSGGNLVHIEDAELQVRVGHSSISCVPGCNTHKMDSGYADNCGVCTLQLQKPYVLRA